MFFRVTPGLQNYSPQSTLLSSTVGPWERFGVELVLSFLVVYAHFSIRSRKLFNNGSMMIGVAYAACTLVGVSSASIDIFCFVTQENVLMKIVMC